MFRALLIRTSKSPRMLHFFNVAQNLYFQLNVSLTLLDVVLQSHKRLVIQVLF